MRLFPFLVVVLSAASSFAADAGSDFLVNADAGVSQAVVDAGMVTLVPGLDDPTEAIKHFYSAAKSGNGWLAAMFGLFLFVGLLRGVGRRVHALIPDDTQHPLLRPTEKVLSFIFDTKIGGWLLNWLTAIGGCLGTAFAAGAEVDAAAWKVAFIASTGATALIELKDDVLGWWVLRKAAKEEEVQRKAEVIAATATEKLPDPAATPPM